MSDKTRVAREIAEMLRDLDAATGRLRILVDWGHGGDAPFLAKRDWVEAREWLDGYDRRQDTT